GLYAPRSGMLEAINPEVLRDPGAINVDKYGDGWLMELSSVDPQPLLHVERYCAHLAEAWEVAQRTIKGQANA
ncbi:MAG: glycine cleavage system protein H, partial [bacterium]